MGWGTLFGIQPSPIAHFYSGYEIRDRLNRGISGSVRLFGQEFTFYPGGGPSFTSSGVVVGTWNTSVSRIGCAISFPSMKVTISRGS
jgi:hypothetical protein